MLPMRCGKSRFVLRRLCVRECWRAGLRARLACSHAPARRSGLQAKVIGQQPSRVRIPQRASFGYTRRPQSQLTNVPKAKETSEQRARVIRAMGALPGQAKRKIGASGVSVEGAKMNF